ncbi:MAG: trypsin-like peptidase domain-containing protein [Planctomycetales bacterium]|nr:trypsin-like peptidase domain-containing protein [Planctomycetales bacterium]
MRCRLFQLAVILVILCRQGSSVQAQNLAAALEETIVKLIERVEPAVVSIARVRLNPNALDAEPIHRNQRLALPPTDVEHADFQPNDFGAGILIASNDGRERLVLTNYHVVRGGPVAPAFFHTDGSILTLRLANRRLCRATIIAADPRSDLAILKPDFEDARIDPTQLTPLDWSQSSTVRKGQFVVILGNPYALARDGSASVSWGMISNMTRQPLPWTKETLASSTLYRLGNLLQIDGRMNLGTSGGPVINMKGELVGITTSLAVVDGYEKSAGFAIPLDDMSRRIVKSLVAGHEVEYGMLGIVPREISQLEFLNLNTGVDQASAARASLVASESPAYRAGIRSEDAILKIADQPVLSVRDLMRTVGLFEPESAVDVVVWRNGIDKPFTVKVTLGKWPVQDDEGIIATNPRWPSWRGLSIDYPTGRSKYMRDSVMNAPYRRAVLVTGVADKSAASEAELQSGDFIARVNGIPVETPANFHAAVAKAKGPVTLSLYQGASAESRSVIVRE